MGLLNLFKRKTFSHGIHPPEYKEETAHKPIRRLPFAPEMVIPLSQHFGAAAIPLVHPGQEVLRGEPVARADGFMSAPIHAPATGIIEDIHLMPTARGPKVESIILKAHPGASQRVLYGAELDVDTMSAEELVKAIQDTGMVGLGGAGFPTHVKLTVPPEHPVDTLVVNGCECEPYLTTDHRIMLEHTDELIRGIRIAMRASGTRRAVIGIEDNKSDAIKAIRERLKPEDPIAVQEVRTKYPQGSEKLLITVLLGREVPSGGLPFQVGVVVNNVGTLAEIGRLLPKGEGLIERVVTIAGPEVKKPGNYLVPLGTPLRFILEQVGYFGDAGHLILGGPMMGTTVASLDVPITKPVSGLVVLPEESANEHPDRVYPCIRCGTCVDACPIHLNPSRLGQLAARRQYETMAAEFHLNDCFECGCCSYVCPSNIPLVQYFRIAKSVNRERAA
ncbi:electron transport complex subunit RsxC [Thiohalomonas denitrificans]|uniref:Ion-translocating oxidoreductase complex subunit C n=1 Tax=Thiohalomonas denitrificans TaxID=415747 RepID=A0A1G5PHY1_9GAMM|nr:electron transport complex subunit RsxC [Thiohalomonas denitrificans]SCZ49125.1 electron transport complex protein RnfC [Thiohalomonas denitrificans]